MGEPDMPATMPPVTSRNDWGPVIWPRMKSTPGPMPFGCTPRTVTSNEVMVWPSITVDPVAVSPLWTASIGYTAGGLVHEPAAGAGAACTASAPTRAIATIAAWVPLARARRDRPLKRLLDNGTPPPGEVVSLGPAVRRDKGVAGSARKAHLRLSVASLSLRVTGRRLEARGRGYSMGASRWARPGRPFRVDPSNGRHPMNDHVIRRRLIEQRERLISILSGVEAELADVEWALRRVAEGAYGRC